MQLGLKGLYKGKTGLAFYIFSFGEHIVGKTVEDIPIFYEKLKPNSSDALEVSVEKTKMLKNA